VTLRTSVAIFASAISVLGAVTTAMAASAEPRVVQTVRVNLDADSALEQVQVMDYARPNPYGGTVPIHVEYGRVVDRVGGRLSKIQVTPRVEHLGVRAVRDGAEDQMPDIWYWGSMGNAGAVPRFYGLVDWNGRKARVLWKYNAQLSSVRRRYAGAHAALFQDPAAQAPGYEVRLEEGVLGPGEPSCCPSQARISLTNSTAHTTSSTSATSERSSQAKGPPRAQGPVHLKSEFVVARRSSPADVGAWLSIGPA
jgi:hypothetical protein